MSPRTVERVDDWDAVPFEGGYSGLRDLASQEFSGVVTAGPSRLFMIRGTVVGVLDGSIDDFEDANGTAREAPHPALPLLAVMQERSDEVRAKYYTEDTPIADVDGTLADGSFTGFVELSENVLSGDYYQVYHQGRSMSVAYVGAGERLITDDEAFEQANGEVGIYEVRPVDIEVIDVPEPANDEGSAGATADAVDDEPTAASTPEDSVATPVDDDRPTSDSDDGEIPSATEEAELGASEPTAESDPVDTDPVEPDPTESAAEPADPASAESTSPAVDDSETPAAGSEPDEPVAEPTEPSEDPSPDPADEVRTPATDVDDSDPQPTADHVRSEDETESPDDTHPGAKASSSSRSQQPTSERSSPESDSSGSERASRSQEPTGGTQPERAPTEPEQPSTPANSAGTEPSSDGPSQSTGAEPASPQNGQRSGGAGSAGSAAHLEVRSIPSLDPARTEAASKATTNRKSSVRNGGPSQSAQSQQSQRRQQDQPSRSQSADRSPDQRPAEQSSQDSGGQATEQTAEQQTGQASTSAPEREAGGPETDQGASSADAPGNVASELESREQEVEDLRTDLERVEAERDELETERAELEAERDRLQTELDEARAEIERLTERLEDFAEDGAGGAEVQLSAAEAIDDTNLFVRYRSKGDATLETAHSGNADRDAVAENMRLEYHTQFDAGEAAVGNEPFDDFLTGTIQYRFVDWLIGSLLYEVRDTGHADGMADLYNALPKIDRAELNGQVSVTYAEDGEEHRSQERFDIVVRDRMGNPLFVANINNSRDPATDAMMTDLVKRAERVGESSETLAGAFLVTESFFEPEALETAEGATSSGLFSRDKRKSFVNLSRKSGYHLCLVEARNQEFHLAVPEL